MAKAKETWQLNFQRKINCAYIEVIRSEPSKAGIFQREHNLLSHCIYFNPLSVHGAAGQAWWSEISCAGDWYDQALTSFCFPNAMGSITLEMCPKYLFYPHQYKSTEMGSAQPLGHRSYSGHCDSTMSQCWPCSETLAVSTSLCPSWRWTHSLGWPARQAPLPCRGL